MMPDLAIVGGAGHVGLPLALVFAQQGLNVHIVDRDETALAAIRDGRMPFDEEGGARLLEEALRSSRLSQSSRMSDIAGVPVVIVTIGTPVDQFLSPDTRVIKAWADEALSWLSDDQLIILRSTVYPGTTEWLGKYLAGLGRRPKLAFCPERIAQRFAIRELSELPQLVSGTTADAERRSADLFRRIAPEVIALAPLEAEFAKLFTNSFRYITFAIVNQFYMLATEHGADFSRILHACRHNYPRMAGMPGAGLAAGPCLLKDTMQLAAFSNNRFSLGHDAMLVNEGLPAFLVGVAKRKTNLADKTVGILGMAFKAESDDARDSLSYRLRKLLILEARQVLCTDPYVRDDRLVPLEQVMNEADVVFIGAPHLVYRELQFRPETTAIDVWEGSSAATADEPCSGGAR
ncbi:MAG: nucleotide sugar dehydrogenase [Planctomycetaceae bacterium]|nr:nucleotide sugar dehydrogenase [Planctomycetaceae bacterium]